jgi:serine/threonine-protein kinase
VGELFAKHMLEEPPPVLEFAPNIPAHMAGAIMKALAKEPSARFQSMEELRKALVGEVKVALPAGQQTAIPGSRRASNTMAQTMSPQASTTLSSGAAEIDEAEAAFGQPARRKRMFAIGGGAVVALGLVGFLAMGKNEAKPPVVAPPPPTTTAPPPPVTPPAPPVKKTVTVRFEAEPVGVHVFNKKDDKDLGVVPLEVQLSKDAVKNTPAAYVLRLPGFKDKALSADGSADRTFHVALEKVPAAAPEPAKKRPPQHHTGGAKHPKNPVDEDGLATPSF